MSPEQHDEIMGWKTRLDALIAMAEHCCVGRVVAVESVETTMDPSLWGGGDEIGVLVVASQQTSGRGQRGRRWHDGDHRTLPCTFVVDSSQIGAPILAALVGCAVHQAIAIHVPASSEVMIKWPNDIVIRDSDHSKEPNHSADRKIAGVLIEQRGSVSSIGIGINCTQRGNDWAPEIRSSATSMHEIGSQVTRFDVLSTLIETLSDWMHRPDLKMIRAYWARFDAMIGTTRTFAYQGEQVTGIVEHLDPLEAIRVRTHRGVEKLGVAQVHHLGNQLGE